MRLMNISEMEGIMSTKEKILDAALTLFAENGYDGTSVEQIANIVGIKAPSLYKHYKGKEDILNALIDSAEARYEEMFGSENNIGKVPESPEEFIIRNYYRLHFSPEIKTVVKDVKKNPKRAQRDAKKQTLEKGKA